MFSLLIFTSVDLYQSRTMHVAIHNIAIHVSITYPEGLCQADLYMEILVNTYTVLLTALIISLIVL